MALQPQKSTKYIVSYLRSSLHSIHRGIMSNPKSTTSHSSDDIESKLSGSLCSGLCDSIDYTDLVPREKEEEEKDDELRKYLKLLDVCLTALEENIDQIAQILTELTVNLHANQNKNSISCGFNCVKQPEDNI